MGLSHSMNNRKGQLWSIDFIVGSLVFVGFGWLIGGLIGSFIVGL